jgi:hypothetical protein
MESKSFPVSFSDKKPSAVAPSHLLPPGSTVGGDATRDSLPSLLPSLSLRPPSKKLANSASVPNLGQLNALPAPHRSARKISIGSISKPHLLPPGASPVAGAARSSMPSLLPSLSLRPPSKKLANSASLPNLGHLHDALLAPQRTSTARKVSIGSISKPPGVWKPASHR